MRADESSAGTAIDLIGFVTRHLACAQCHTAYTPSDVHVTQHERDEWLLLATCPTCSAQRTITAYDGPPYLRLDGPYGPLLPPLTPLDVAECRAFLSRFTGDMIDLLAEG
jgi:NAD-dependent SIR2 family protein deacetylase